LAEAEHCLAQSLAAHADPHQITLDTVERLLIAARLATAQQEYLRAALLFGLAKATHNASQTVLAQPMRALADAALATVQAALEPAVFAEAFAAGQQMALAEAFAIMLTPGQVTSGLVGPAANSHVVLDSKKN
jgi:hypothetical protein